LKFLFLVEAISFQSFAKSHRRANLTGGKAVWARLTHWFRTPETLIRLWGRIRCSL